LISGPKLVYEKNYDVVLSKKHGVFMQPSTNECPICHRHKLRIEMEGSTEGFMVPLEAVPRATTEHVHHSKPIQPISNAELQRFGAVHTTMGGGITRGNIAAFMEAYPEYAEKMKLPKRFSDPLVTNTIDSCHCCDRTKMTKSELPGEVEHHCPAPLEEIHLDLFTYPNDPRYDAIFIDRASRYVWHYALGAKSDLESKNCPQRVKVLYTDGAT